MKKIITLSAIAVLSTATYANTEMQTQIDELTAKIEKLEKKQGSNTKNISKVNKLANKDNIKFDVDFRTSYDNLQYKTAANNEYSNDALYSMRLLLGMGYAPADNILFKGQLSYNKAFGASYGQRGTGMGFDTFDWISSETLNDDTVRVREAYWLWTPTVGGFPTTLSVGRRPATSGYLINLRDDEKAKSPLGHVINMEFDGASASIKLDEYVPGMQFKICAGRGLTNAASWASQASGTINPMFPNTGTTPDYAEVDGALNNTDMLGFIFTPYDDGQYAVETTFYRGFDVPGMVNTDPTVYYSSSTGAMLGMAPGSNFEMQNTGDMDGAAISFKVEGIGDEINDFLDETIVFASFAWSKSRPDDTTRTATMVDMDGVNPTGPSDIPVGMLGSADSETGTSYWVGIQTPNLTGGKFGLEYNHGSEHWRSFTYGEDTMAGSKMAVRGSAYEAYWTQPIIDKVFSMQVRYTYLDYDYTGSSGFFGDGSSSFKMGSAESIGMDAVETAQDIRVYFRYRY